MELWLLQHWQICIQLTFENCTHTHTYTRFYSISHDLCMNRNQLLNRGFIQSHYAGVKFTGLSLISKTFYNSMFWTFSFFFIPRKSTINSGLNLIRHGTNSSPVPPSVFNFSGQDMGKGLFLSKIVAAACVVAAIGAAATIIALSVVYAQEKSKNEMTPQSTASPTTSPTTPSTPKEPWQRYRLPKSLAPIAYNVTLWPRLERNTDKLFVFTGHSTVVFRCVTETDLLLIHSNKLNLSSFEGYHAKLRGLSGEAAPGLKATWLESPTQYLVVQLSSPLQAGSTYELFTEFVGELADDLGGFYRSEYIEDGVTK